MTDKVPIPVREVKVPELAVRRFDTTRLEVEAVPETVMAVLEA